ncbi:MAG: hypothetical protein OHK93_003349 [Ramalina farinacea]|uniref:Uncharacterized protein n=1 Tax=Ramalina farinacea TaxID=258253 RepID=A0AA43U161_9LECA|nr:hypothetical protein [Ramalina farinacea]
MASNSNSGGTSNHDPFTAINFFAAQFPSTSTSRNNTLSFFDRFNNLSPRTLLTVNANENATNGTRDDDDPARPHRLSLWLLFVYAVTAVAVFTWIFTSLLYPRTVVVVQCRKCDRIVHFPLPYPINRTAHQAVLIQLGSMDRYTALVAGYADLSASLHATGHELAELANRTDRGTQEMAGFSEQLGGTAAEATKLRRLYDSLQLAYSQLNATAVEGADGAAFGRLQRFAVRAGPWSLPFLGMNATRAYWDPWVDRQLKAEKARAGLAALNRETRRLEWIEEVLRELNQEVQQLDNILYLWGVDRNYGSSSQGPKTAWMDWLRVRAWGKKAGDAREDLIDGWIKSHITHNGRLRDLWNKRSTLMRAGDEVMVIRVSEDRWW